jgi:hypothetical protein
MPLADWTVPFKLTSAQWSGTLLDINTPVAFNNGTGIYLLRNDACQLSNVVRETKDFIPQFNGALLHRRFVGGMEMSLTIQLWQNDTQIACDELLQEMLDELMGYLWQLLNAEDNEGRISWAPAGGSSSTSTQRMLDDIRLLTYPTGSQAPGAPFEITVSVDTQYPYAEDLTQQLSSIATGTTVVVNNTGTEPTAPVFQVNKLAGVLGSGGTTFEIQNLTTGITLSWNGANSGGGGAITAAQYLEIDTFRNTIFTDGTGSNRTPGIDMPDSDFPLLVPGNNSIHMVGMDADMLWNPAWA